MLYILCGIPGSGKTTYARKLAKELNAMLYSYDERPGANQLGKMNSSHVAMWQDILNDLNSGNDVICDDVHTTKKQRASILDALKDANCRKVLVVMSTPLNLCIERNANRPNRIPDIIIRSIYKTYDSPTLDEGWDEIIYI